MDENQEKSSKGSPTKKLRTTGLEAFYRSVYKIYLDLSRSNNRNRLDLVVVESIYQHRNELKKTTRRSR